MDVTVITGQADVFETSKYFPYLASSTSEEVAFDHCHKVMLRHAPWRSSNVAKKKQGQVVTVGQCSSSP